MTSKYLFKKQIAGGSFGQVWEANSIKTNEKVAIKILDLNKEYSDKYKRIYREISILHLIKSKYSINLVDIFINNGNGIHQICLVLPFLAYDLRCMMNKFILNFNQNIKIIYQILLALQYLSACGILHRDIKPSNIGVDGNLQLRLLDFGLARDINPDMTDYVVSRWYRPIEVFCTPHYTASVDMWSAGCILVELLTQSVLFKGSGATDQVVKILTILGMPQTEVLDQMDENTRLGFNLFKNHAAKTNILELHISEKTKKYLENQEEKVDIVFPNLILLIKGMLDLNPAKRISPNSALKADVFEPHRSMLAQYEPDPLPPKPCELDIAFDMTTTNKYEDDAILNSIQGIIKTFYEAE